jgi:flavin reductase (DIM6/NTAB) family NADH-FMN oxidoreductase RutF
MSEPILIDSRSMREALGCFATGVTIVTAQTVTGDFLGITANSFNAVSLEPPLVLVSLDRRLRSFTRFEASRRFAINVLGAHQKELSQIFATAGADKWRAVSFSLGVHCGAPLFEDAHAMFECEQWSRQEAGDHVIFVGRVLELRVNPHHAPLLFYRGDYRALGGNC